MTTAGPARTLATAEGGALSPGYAAPSCGADGECASDRFAPAGGLWLVVARLAVGTTLAWSGDHGDEGLYVRTGALVVGGERCEPGGAVIVERGVATSLRADEPTELVHVGAAPTAPLGKFDAGDPGRGVHVFTGDGLEPIDDGSASHWYYADSTCATCDIAFFRIEGDAGYASPSHVHSADEIIHVLSGSLAFGRQVVASGSSVAIPAGRRYGFRSTGPFAFLNYRAVASTVTMAPDGGAFEESARAVRRLVQRRQARR